MLPPRVPVKMKSKGAVKCCTDRSAFAGEESLFLVSGGALWARPILSKREGVASLTRNPMGTQTSAPVVSGCSGLCVGRAIDKDSFPYRGHPSPDLLPRHLLRKLRTLLKLRTPENSLLQSQVLILQVGTARSGMVT